MSRLAFMWPWASPFVWTRAVESFLALRIPEDLEVRFIRGVGWCPARRHADACEKALEADCEYLMFFGADQLAPADLIERLWARIKEGHLPITGLVPSRGYFDQNAGTRPFQPLAWRWKDGVKTWEYRNQQDTPGMVELIRPHTGLQVVHFVGSGCLVFHRDHLLSLCKPWFRETFDGENYRRQASMDTNFAWRLLVEASGQIVCDTDIIVQHLHDMAIDESFENRFQDWADGDKPNPDPSIIQRLRR